MVPNFSRSPKSLIAPCRTTFGEKIVDEHHTMSNEAITPYSNQFANKTMRLNFCATSNCYIFLNLDKWPDETLLSNNATIHVNWFHHFYVISKNNVLLYS